MDFLVVHPSFRSMGGEANLALQVIRNFKERGYEVTLLTMSCKEVLKKCSEKLGIKLDKINVIHYDVPLLERLPVGFFNIFFTKIFFIRFFLEKILKKLGKFDIIWNNVGDFIYTRPFLKYSRNDPIFYVHFPLRAFFKYAKYYGEFSSEIYIYHKILSFLATILEDSRYLEKVKIYTNSSFTAREFEKIYGIRPKVKTPTISIPKEFKWSGEKKENIIVTVGRITPEKGQLRLIIAINKIKDLLIKDKWKVLIIGGYKKDIFGVKRRYLRKLKEYIKKFGLDNIVEIKLNVPFKELTTILKKSKIYVHTMIGEHFGISAYEAKEAGCILVLPKKSGAWEDIEYDKKYCFDNVEDLAKILLKLLRGR